MSIESVELNKIITGVTHLIGKLLVKRNSVVCSTKFGPHSLVFLHLINRISNSIPVIWVDTGYSRRETIEYAARVESLLGLNLHVFQSSNHVMRIPPELGDNDHYSFTKEVKLEPFKHALETLNATHWISSVRAYQTDYRQQLPTTMTLNNGLTKVHPMLTWTEGHMSSYLERYKLPLGPETFDPTKGDSVRECGLHT
jgi:phosphoadenosine phosphosulfate reductase